MYKYSTVLCIYVLYLFFFLFHDNVVGGGVLFSLLKFFLFVNVLFFLLRQNTISMYLFGIEKLVQSKAGFGHKKLSEGVLF